MKFSSYGAHPLYNQRGVHRVLNFQTGRATMRFCTRSNGTGCGAPVPPATLVDRDLTPINSILLQPS